MAICGLISVLSVVTNMIYVEQGFLANEYACQVRDDILAQTNWTRYENPFEQKSVLVRPYSENIEQAFDSLMLMLYKAEHLLDTHLRLDAKSQYSAVFRYDEWDRLSLHKDAERCPQTHRAKLVTVCMYLSTDDQVGCPLEFFNGNRPERRTAVLEPTFNTLVIFDDQWHGCPEPVLCGTRIVVTVSFMGDVVEQGRERAYFAPKPGEVWSKEMCELRDLRADPQRYHEVYRV